MADHTPTPPLPFLAVLALGLLLAGCASVTTRVVELKPAQRHAPTEHVEILFAKPERPHEEIALIETRGQIGASEAELLEQAREQARAVGAHALVKLETERNYHPPLAVYDPWYDPFWGFPRYRLYPYRPYPPYIHPWGAHRVVPGGYSYTLKAVAIRYPDPG
jgi:hypothetical protein